MGGGGGGGGRGEAKGMLAPSKITGGAGAPPRASPLPMPMICLSFKNTWRFRLTS